MKKNITLTGSKAVIAIVAASMTLFACTKETIPDPTPESPRTPVHPAGYVCFTANAPEADADPVAAALPDTRAGYDGVAGHAVWEEGDRLGVSVNGMYVNSNILFTQKSGSLSDDRRTAEFEGTFAQTPTGTKQFHAIYPYDSAASYSGTKFTTTFPGRQVYTPGGYTGIPLFGKYEGELAGLHFENFMNPFAIVELRLASAETGARVKEIILQGNNGETVAGTIDVEMNGERPAVTFNTEFRSKAAKGITLDCGEGVLLSTDPTSFYIAIPVQEYAKGYRFDIRTDRADAKDVVLFAMGRGATPLANTIVRTPVKTLIAADYKKLIPDKTFRDWLETNGFVTVTDETTGEVDILETAGTISVANQSIASLADVEYFPDITMLICNNNQLTTLDLSANTKLTTLSCYSNRLTTLDVSANTQLTSLSCYSNQLTTLDVSKNTSLTLLTCYSNQLTMLDVSKNISLTTLYCYSNPLTTLDVSKNTSLTTLYCYSNQLSTLDVSKNTSLTMLYCYSNQLTTLDVSKNTSLKTLYCSSNPLTTLDVSQNASLTSLYCSSNQLTTLDVLANRQLTTLSCYSNQLKELNVSANTLLQTLDCYDNQLTTLDVSKNTSLTSINCSRNELKELNVSANTRLKMLTCPSNQLPTLDISTNKELMKLTCSNNRLTTLDVSNNTSLILLDCYSNQLTTLNATTMANPDSYILFCGMQQSATGASTTLQLTLKTAQQTRWNSSMSINTNNKGTVEVTFVP